MTTKMRDAEDALSVYLALGSMFIHIIYVCKYILSSLTCSLWGWAQQHIRCSAMHSLAPLLIHCPALYSSMEQVDLTCLQFSIVCTTRFIGMGIVELK